MDDYTRHPLDVRYQFEGVSRLVDREAIHRCHASGNYQIPLLDMKGRSVGNASEEKRRLTREHAAELDMLHQDQAGE